MPTGLTVLSYFAAGALLLAGIVVVIVGLKAWKTVGAIDRLVHTAEADLGPLLQESREVVRNVSALTTQVKEKTDRVSRLVPAVEQILGGLAVAATASKVMRSSSVTAVTVLEGLKVGLRALRGASNQSKEVSGNE